MVSPSLPTLRDRLRERLAITGKSPRALSMEIGANQGYVRDLLDPDKGGVPSAERLQRLAAALETTTDYLMGRAASAEQPASEVGFRDINPGWRGPKGDGIRLVGTAYCDDLVVDSDEGKVEVERVQLDIDHTVRMIERPAALWNATDAYAIYMHGSSMEPRFFQGEPAIVDPRRPPGPGDYVLVQLNDGLSDDVLTVLVKRLVRVATGFVELEQHNPPMKFRLPRRQVGRMHRIYRPDELLG